MDRVCIGKFGLQDGARVALVSKRKANNAPRLEEVAGRMRGAFTDGRGPTSE